MPRADCPAADDGPGLGALERPGLSVRLPDGRALPDMEALAASEYERAIQLHNAQAQGVTAGALGWVSLAEGRLLSAINHFRESVAVLDEADWTAVRSQSLAGLTESLALGRRSRRRADAGG